MAAGEPTGDVWIYWKGESGKRIGAYLPPSTDDETRLLTVFWRSNLSRSMFRSILLDAESTFRDRPNYQARLFSYGEERDETGPVRGGLPDLVRPGYDGFRAELGDDAGTMVVWATLDASPALHAKGMDENIGICIDVGDFENVARRLIADAICKDVDYDRTEVDQLLDDLVLDVSRYVARPSPQAVSGF